MPRTTFVSSSSSDLAALVWEGNRDQAFVLVHGLSSNAETWAQVGDVLNARGCHVVAYDQRSHGRSEHVPDGYTFVAYRADLQAVIDQSFLTLPVTAGQSWGGNVVVNHAAHHEVAAVVGVDGGFINLQQRFPEWEACAAALAPPPLNGTPRSTIESYLLAAHPNWSEASIQATMSNFHINDDESVRPNLAFDEHMLVLRSLWEHDPITDLAHTPVPTTVIAARPTMGPSAAIESAGFDTVHWLDGDHDLHLHHPELVADLLWEAAPWVP